MRVRSPLRNLGTARRNASTARRFDGVCGGTRVFQRAARRGFTLLEVLVAIALTMVITAALYGSLYIGVRASRNATAAIQPARTAALTLELLRQDFDAALQPKGVFAGPFQGNDGSSSGPASDALTFYTASNLPRDGEVGGDLRKVELYLNTPPNDTAPALYRRLTANLLASQQPVVHEQVLCRRVKALNLNYYDGTQWQPAWDSTANNNVLPAAVQVIVEFECDGDKAGKPEQAVQPTYRTTHIFALQCAQPAPAASTGK